MRDAPRRRRECCHAAVNAAVEEGYEAAAVVADKDQLGEMARWLGRSWGAIWKAICRDLFEVAAREVLKCSLSQKERGHLRTLDMRANTRKLQLVLSRSLLCRWQRLASRSRR